MFELHGTNITMTRGDSLAIYIKAYSQNKLLYSPTENDVITFAVKEKYEDENCVITKTISPETMILELSPEDTKELPQPSTYVYEISLEMENGIVDTFIKGTLTIQEEIQ